MNRLELCQIVKKTRSWIWPEQITWFELELGLLPLPAPDAPDALAAVEASAEVAGDSPCCDEPDEDK